MVTKVVLVRFLGLIVALLFAACGGLPEYLLGVYVFYLLVPAVIYKDDFEISFKRGMAISAMILVFAHLMLFVVVVVVAIFLGVIGVSLKKIANA